MSKTAFVTIVSNNYLHFARTLMQSIAACHPEVDRYCVIVDKDMTPARQLEREFQAISLEQLHLPDGEDFLFQYTVLELNTAVKPWALDYLLSHGYDRVAYIDPDIYLYRPLHEVLELLDDDADIVLTPHLLSPIDDSYYPTELDIRRAGTYNLGFCAMAESDNTRHYLHWWQKKLRYDCVVDVDRGVFVDQSWMDLVPGLFDNVEVLRHPGYNVAYWNLAQREVTSDSETQCLVDGHPLIFFHFSGLNYSQPHAISKHQNRLTFGNVGQTVEDLFRSYAANIKNNDAPGYSKLSYGYACYDGGRPISAAERERFRKDPVLRHKCQGKPFYRPDLLSFAEADEESTSAGPLVDPACAYRVQKMFQALLGRDPERKAIIVYGRRMKHPVKMALSVLRVGLSREARQTSGWLARLLRFVNTLHLIPRPAKRWLVEPACRVVEVVGRRWTTLAWRPPGSHTLLGVRDTHKILRPQRVDRPPQGPVASLPSLPGIDLVGYLRAELGVGEAVRSLARACNAVQIAFSTTDVSYQTANLARDDSIKTSIDQRNYPVNLLYVNADQVARTVQQLQDSGDYDPKYTIGFWHWEQPELPAYLHGAFAHVDEVWVPTTFVHDAVAAVSPVPVYKIPHALELTASPHVKRQDFGLPTDRRLALVMYDFHSYQYRKNPEAAIAAYRLAARKKPDCGLVIKTINNHHYPQAYAELKEQVADLPHVYFIDEFLTRQQVWNLQSCCDVLLSLHRAEGFGLAPAEMMCLGKPVIATGWSGNMDFMTAENSFPVRYQLKPLEVDLGAYPAGPLWAEADIEHAAWCLGQLADNDDLARRLGEQARRDIRAQLSPEHVGGLVRRRLRILRHWYPDLIEM